jgi:hypothetical protein
MRLSTGARVWPARVLAAAALGCFATAGTGSAAYAASDAATLAASESGYLACPAGQVVWITERSGPGVTTVRFSDIIGRQRKVAWSTTEIRTGLQATDWSVTTTGALDTFTTGARCRK